MDASWYYVYYYVIFLIVSSLFLVNLFAGVMFMHFTQLQNQAQSSFMDIMITKDQLNWIEVQRLIIMCEPNYNSRTVPPSYNWRKPFHSFVTSTPFEIFISIIILLNMLQMAMLYDRASSDYLFGLDIINYIFTGIFTVEVILKLISYSMEFWYDAWNIFDLFIVLSSFADIIVSNASSNSLKMLRIGPQLIRVLRVLRVSRLLRLIKKYKRLQEIVEIIQLCLPSIMNVLALLTLVYFIFAVTGCYLYAGHAKGEYISDWFNFDNFGFAMMLLLKLATGEDWNNFMFEYARTSDTCTAGLGCGDAVTYIYFLAFKFFISFVMINLFVLITLELFDKYFIQSDNIVSKFKEEYEVFQEHWQNIGPIYSGYMMSQDKLMRFFRRIPEPMGMEGMDPNLMSRRIVEMGIRRYCLLILHF